MSGIETLVETIGASPAAEAVARALVHFLWQGALVGAVTGGILAFLDKGRASTRYAVALGALFFMAALPIATASRLVDRTAGPLKSAITAERAVSVSPEPVASAPIASRASSAGEARTFGVSLLPWIFRLWLAGVAALSLFHLGGWSRVRRLPRQGRPVGEELQSLASGLGQRLGISRVVALLESSTISVPMVVGWLRPVVLVPASALTGLPPSQLAAILAHELAHVRRHDYLVNLLQAAVETLLFYHPAVWWASAQARRERENCCDDLAVLVCGDRLGYARALANLEGLRAPSSPLVLAASGGSLVERIRRLVGAPVHRPRHSWMAGVLALSLLPLAGLDISHAAPSGAVTVAQAVDSPAVPMPARPAPAAVRTETPAREGRPSRGTWSAERRGDKIELSLSWSSGRSRSQSSFSIAENQLAGLTAGPEVRFELRRDAGTFRFEGRFDGAGKGAQGTGFFTFEGNPAYTGQMASLGYTMRDDRLREYALFDVSLAFAREIRSLGYGKVTAERLVEFRIHGVSPEFIREVADAGHRNLSAERLVEFRIHGVSPEFIREMADAGYRDLPAERLVEFRIHGINAEFVRKAASEGYRDLSSEELVELRIMGRLERGRR
jgi:beta-lactamase regulating signal transducer with metallopeptidase domain